MGSRLNRIGVVLLAVVAICACQSVRPRISPVPAKSVEVPPLGIGLIAHRGKFYRLEDLMDPAYRAASSDKFVRDFGDSHIVTGWSGATREERDAADRRRRILTREPWAGLDPRIWSGRDSQSVGD